MQGSVLLVILLSQAIGGIAPVLTKLALGGLGPWTLVAGRQLLGAAVLLAVGLWMGALRGPHARFSRRDWALLLCLSWAGFALPQILLAHGIERSTATNGALLSPLEPIGILLGGAALLAEPLSGPRLFAIALGTLGATLIVLEGAAVPELGDPLGDVLIALGHLAWAIYTLAAKSLLERHEPLRVTLLSVGLALPPVVPLALGEPLDPAAALPALGWLVALAVLASGLGTWTWNWSLRRVSAGTMATMIFVQPLVGLGAGVLGLGERVGAQGLCGAALIVAGVTVAALRGEHGP